MDKKHILIFISLSGILVIVFVLSNLVGSSQLTFSKSIYYLFHPNASGMGRDIIWQIRFPGVMLGLLVGAGLACCGVVFQGLLRNPLAEPYTLGVSGGAALGVSISVVFAVSTISMASFAFLGSTISIFLVYAIALRKRFSNTTLILGGVI